jgi:hypothetical protein
MFFAFRVLLSNENILTRKSSGDHQVKIIKEGKKIPEEQEGMPQQQHCLPECCRYLNTQLHFRWNFF